MSLDAPLLTDVELKSVNGSEITIENVMNSHQVILNGNGSISDKTREIITILGGMDIVLTNYLSNIPQNEISNLQLQQLNALLLSKNLNQNMSTIGAVKPNQNTLMVSKHDTFLHSRFGTIKADKIVDILFGKIGICILTIILIPILIYSTLPFFTGNEQLTSKEHGAILIWSYTFLSIYLIVFNIFLILAMFSLNKEIAKKVLKTFEFWFKISYVIMYGVCVDIYYFRGYEVSELIVTILLQQPAFLFVALFSLIDALNVSNRFKIIVLISWALIWSVRTIHITLVANNDLNDPFRILHLWGQTSVDLLALEASAFRVLSIFMWKQAIYSLYYKNKSTLLSKSITIQWQ